MDYPHSKFSECSFSCFGFIVRTDRQTDKQKHTHTDATECLTPTAVVGVNNKPNYYINETVFFSAQNTDAPDLLMTCLGHHHTERDVSNEQDRFCRSLQVQGKTVLCPRGSKCPHFLEITGKYTYALK